jgi:transposase
MLGCIDAITADIAALDAQIEAQLAPSPQRRPAWMTSQVSDRSPRRSSWPGSGWTCPGSRPRGICVPWAKFSPGIASSAGKSRGNGSSGHGNRYLARALGEAAVVAARTDSFLGERYRRTAKRRGKKRAIVAVGRPIQVII